MNVMNAQEAYNKGLDDAEGQIIAKLITILEKGDIDPFQNPKLNEVVGIVKLRSDYYTGMAERNNNVGKGFKKKVEAEQITLDKVKS